MQKLSEILFFLFKITINNFCTNTRNFIYVAFPEDFSTSQDWESFLE